MYYSSLSFAIRKRFSRSYFSPIFWHGKLNTITYICLFLSFYGVVILMNSIKTSFILLQFLSYFLINSSKWKIIQFFFLIVNSVTRCIRLRFGRSRMLSGQTFFSPGTLKIMSSFFYAVISLGSIRSWPDFVQTLQLF